MSDKEAVRLAEHIIRDSFGDLVGHVASVLLNRGRLNLVELCHYAKLRARSAQAVIIILIQHNLAWHCEAPSGDNLIEYFEINLKECLMRLRWGRILALTEDEFGEDGRTIVELLLTRGKMRLPEILEAMNVADDTRKKKLMKLVLNLINTSHVLPTSGKLFIAPFDDMYQKRRAAERAISGLPTANQLSEIRSRILEEVREARKQEQSPDKAIIKGVKRKANGTSSSSKKAKTDDMETVNPKAYLRVNYERYDLQIRNQLIETAAADRWNKPAGYVIKAVLKATMSDQTNLRQHVTAPTSVAMMLPQLSDKERDALAIGFGAKYPSSRNRAAELVSAYCALLAGEDNLHADRAQGVFLENEGGSRGGGSQYRVSLEKVCGRLKRQLLDAVVTEKWGNNAKRLISIIELNGMTSEPKLAETALIPLSTARGLCGVMHEANLIELQQIPRGTERAAQRMIFFWFIDLSRTYASILSMMYKTLGNLAQRRAAELDKRKQVLERANRTDVRENPELLSERDRKELKELREVLDKIALAEVRTEMNVFVLRDLPGGPPSTAGNDDFFV